MKHLAALLVCLCVVLMPRSVRAEQVQDNELAAEIRQYLYTMDLGGLAIDKEDPITGAVFDAKNIREWIIGFINGEIQLDAQSIAQSALRAIMESLRSNTGILFKIVVLCAITGIFGLLGADTLGGGTAKVCRYLGALAAMTVTVSLLKNAFSIGIDAIISMTGILESMFPVMLTTLTALGASATAGVFKPAMTFLAGSIVTMIKRITMPAILAGGVLTLADHLSDKIQIKRVTDMVLWAAKWMTTFVFTVFLGITALQGMTSAVTDGIGLRTTKYAIDKMVPIIGGMVADTADTVIACSLVVKQGVGVAGLLLIACAALTPVLRIVALSLLMRLAGMVIEPFGNKNLAKCMERLSYVLTLMYLAVLTVATMMFILITLMIRAGSMTIMMR
ncbi:MAG: stage III sporulation protein AE [Clostridia bacterium]|nr:stage III sporulation protein AE [Clostridia bacterium]